MTLDLLHDLLRPERSSAGGALTAAPRPDVAAQLTARLQARTAQIGIIGLVMSACRSPPPVVGAGLR